MIKISSADLSFKIKTNTVAVDLPKPQPNAEPAVIVHQKPKVETKPEAEMASNNKAVFKLLDNNRTVIQFIDEKGNVVRQTPPKEVIAAAERMQESIEHLVDREA